MRSPHNPEGFARLAEVMLRSRAAHVFLMTDPLRSHRPSSAADVPEREREARVDALLLTGLDHYFAAEHELAISIWTRVLFLDHGHARARAYIERARSAIAERQREAEELLHTGSDAFARGDVATARRVLMSAVERGAGSEEALTLLERLNRLETAAPQHESQTGYRATPTVSRDSSSAVHRPPSSRAVWIAAGVVTGAAVAALAVWVWIGEADWRPRERGPAPAVSVRADDEPLPVPSASEAWLARARALHANGRLHDALSALNAVRQGDALRTQADELRATIQRELLATGDRTLRRLAVPQDRQ